MRTFMSKSAAESQHVAWAGWRFRCETDVSVCSTWNLLYIIFCVNTLPRLLAWTNVTDERMLNCPVFLMTGSACCEELWLIWFQDRQNEMMAHEKWNKSKDAYKCTAYTSITALICFRLKALHQRAQTNCVTSVHFLQWLGSYLPGKCTKQTDSTFSSLSISSSVKNQACCKKERVKYNSRDANIFWLDLFKVNRSFTWAIINENMSRTLEREGKEMSKHLALTCKMRVSTIL